MQSKKNKSSTNIPSTPLNQSNISIPNTPITPSLSQSSFTESSNKIIDTNIKDEDQENLSSTSTILKYFILGLICLFAFSIRLFAVIRYESVIHEFDPYFNFRTTKYLAHEGFLDFLNWFDDRGWYPLGRTIGGTIYPGLMLTAAAFYWVLNLINITINIRNVCVFLAPIFSSLASLSSYLLTTEVTKNSRTGLLAAAFVAIVPSYISRSVGGSYDNEGVAIFALIFTFYLWVKSVNTGSMFWSCLCALSYYYMVAAWGGYVFIINIIPIYVLILIIGGRYSHRLYVAYSSFYVLGSLMAMTVPFVGFNVVNQAECAASHGVFFALQIFFIINYLNQILDGETIKKLITTIAFGIVIVVALLLISLQLMGKIQWSGRSLTLLDPTYASKYIPIIASVSEHQPTTWTSFFFDLHILLPLSPVGLYFLYSDLSDGAIFLILYGTLSWYFAGVMVRLLLTLAPIACILAAIGMSEVLNLLSNVLKRDFSAIKSPATNAKKRSNIPLPITIACIIMSLTALIKYSYHSTFATSLAYSSPSIVLDAGKSPSGHRVLFDDYREAYFWLRQNTPEDSKILSWWDYGYQMSAMANRTVLVDNNTWNNTHIATVGRALTSSEESAFPIFESLDVDYVLVVFGGYIGYSSDDINKLLWPVRISTGVFGKDTPNEKDFYSTSGRYDIGTDGAPALLESVAYKCSYYRFDEVHMGSTPPGYDRQRNQVVGIKNMQLEHLEEAFTSEHWIIRIFKVKKRPVTDSKLKKRGSTPKKAKSPTQTPSNPPTTTKDNRKLQYVGCVDNEDIFLKKKYYGGSYGSSIKLLEELAKKTGKRSFAVAKGAGQDGHAFLFDYLSEDAQNYLIDPDEDDNGITVGGCFNPCIDQPEAACGCSDDGCLIKSRPGQQLKRRWAIYTLI